jgi:septum formation protein
LASTSPRRRELLGSIGLGFSIRPAAIDESPLPGESPERHVTRLALGKAGAVGRPGELVLGADTVVVVDGDILGKPEDPADARRMLGRLQGREHRVLTCVALREVAEDRRGATDRVASVIDESAVRMRRLGGEEISWYVATGEPADKAGAYALQGIGGLFVESIRGSSSNVIGLPLAAVYELFRSLGYDLRDFLERPGALGALDTLPPS